MIGLDVFTVFTYANGQHIPVIVNQILNGLDFFSGSVVAILYLYYIVSVALKDIKKET